MLILPAEEAIKTESATLTAFQKLHTETGLIVQWKNTTTKYGRKTTEAEVEQQGLLVDIWRTLQEWGYDIRTERLDGSIETNKKEIQMAWFKLLRQLTKKFFHPRSQKMWQLKLAAFPTVIVRPTLIARATITPSPPATSVKGDASTSTVGEKRAVHNNTQQKKRVKRAVQMTLDFQVADEEEIDAVWDSVTRNGIEENNNDKIERESKNNNENWVMAISTSGSRVLAKRDNCFQIGGIVKVYEHEGADEKLLGYLRAQTEKGFSEEKMEDRRREYGDSCYNKTTKQVSYQTNPKQWRQPNRGVFERELQTGKTLKTDRMAQYRALQAITKHINKHHGVESIRSAWLEALTAVCVYYLDDSSEYKGCGKCPGCWKRFAQVLNLIKGAAGVADKVVVMLWGAVFRSERYRNFTLEDWANLSYQEYAEIANKCSKGASNAYYVLPMLRRIVADSQLPLSVDSVMRFYGFWHKSAALILSAVTGTNHGIPCDRHLFRCFKGLGWIDEDTKDETKVALTIETWLPQKEWGNVNDLLAGLGQLLVDKKIISRGRIIEIAGKLDTRKKVKVLPLVHKIINSLPEGRESIYDDDGDDEDED
jgi:endonuclease III